MDKLYRDNNYLIIEIGGVRFNLAAINTVYNRFLDGEGRDIIQIFQNGPSNGGAKEAIIDVVDVAGGNWVDNLAVVYTVPSLEAFLRINTALIPTGGGGGGGLTYVATDATLDGDGTPGFPLSVVPVLASYEERFDAFLAIVGGVWESVIVPNTPINELITVVCKTSTANVVVGVRMVGSGLNRRIQIDGESATSFNVKTDMLGKIEIYTDNIMNTEFFVTSYLF